MAKDNIIQFPTPEAVSEKEAKQMLQDASDECNGLAQHLAGICIEEITNHEFFAFGDYFDEKNIEARDIYAITNLINAMLLRYLQVPHELQTSLDKLYIKVKQIAQLPETEFEVSFEPDFEVTFEPDFDLNNDKDDKDDNDT
jgi:hypothetical protein